MRRISYCLLTALALAFVPPVYAQSGPDPRMSPAPETAPSPAAPQLTAAAGNTRLAALVPTGLSPEEACRGFKDLGECSATLHIAQNLNIPFADLKDRVTSGQSLGTVIHAFKPDVDARREAQRAEEQAREDLRSQT